MKQSQKVLCLTFSAFAIIIILGLISIRVSNPQIAETEFIGHSINKDFKNFDKIYLSGKVDITVSENSHWALKLDNFSLQALKNLDIYQKGKTLYIKEIETIPNLFNRANIQIVLKMPTLTSIDASGSSKIKIKNFSGNKLLINASGSSYMKAQNVTYDELTVNASDSTDLNLKKLTATHVDANISGRSEFFVRVGNGRLIANASEKSRLNYYGRPSETQIKTSGLAKVRKKTNK